jgi:hypothetical protein
MILFVFFAVEEFYNAWNQSGSFSSINVGNGFSLPAYFFPSRWQALPRLDLAFQQL